jgi:hypothetical protein
LESDGFWIKMESLCANKRDTVMATFIHTNIEDLNALLYLYQNIKDCSYLVQFPVFLSHPRRHDMKARF